MNGFLVIKNRDFYVNLLNLNFIMFKVFVDKVEFIIEDIIFVDVKVMFFEEGSVIVLFYFKVLYDVLYKDLDYFELLRVVNEILW